MTRGGVVDEEGREKSKGGLMERDKDLVPNADLIAEIKAATAPGTREIGANPDACKTTEDDLSQKKKMTLPEVDIQDHLKSNQLLEVIKSQAQILLNEMDSTKEEDGPSDKPKSPGGGLKGSIRANMARGFAESDDGCC